MKTDKLECASRFTDEQLLTAIINLSGKILQAEREVAELKDLENACLIEKLIRETGFKVGTKVRFRAKEWKVVNYVVRYGSPAPVLQLIRKDGSMGQTHTSVSSWQIKSVVIIPEG